VTRDLTLPDLLKSRDKALRTIAYLIAEMDAQKADPVPPPPSSDPHPPRAAG
jgi:hypothetical protein